MVFAEGAGDVAGMLEGLGELRTARRTGRINLSTTLGGGAIVEGRGAILGYGISLGQDWLLCCVWQEI